jgi:hypothetical protein
MTHLALDGEFEIRHLADVMACIMKPWVRLDLENISIPDEKLNEAITMLCECGPTIQHFGFPWKFIHYDSPITTFTTNPNFHSFIINITRPSDIALSMAHGLKQNKNLSFLGIEVNCSTSASSNRQLFCDHVLDGNDTLEQVVFKLLTSSDGNEADILFMDIAHKLVACPNGWKLSYIDVHTMFGRLEKNFVWDRFVAPKLALNWIQQQALIQYETGTDGVVLGAVCAVNSGVIYHKITNVKTEDLATANSSIIFYLLQSSIESFLPAKIESQKREQL